MGAVLRAGLQHVSVDTTGNGEGYEIRIWLASRCAGTVRRMGE